MLWKNLNELFAFWPTIRMYEYVCGYIYICSTVYLLIH